MEDHRSLGVTILFTGLPCAGKTTLGIRLLQYLESISIAGEMLDGDEIRTDLCSDLSFSRHDRDENLRRLGFVAELLSRHGIVVVICAASPFRISREKLRRRFKQFVEVWVNAPLAVCELRDVKGLYHKARSGELVGLTGFDDPYEPPEAPDIECRTDLEEERESSDKIVHYLEAKFPSFKIAAHNNPRNSDRAISSRSA